jgi:hypothetical protein
MRCESLRSLPKYAAFAFALSFAATPPADATTLYVGESSGFGNGIITEVDPLTGTPVGASFTAPAGLNVGGLAFVPEPGTGLLVMTGLLGLAGWRRRRV